MAENTRDSRGPRRRDGSMGEQAPKEFEERVIHIDRVARVVKGGRRFRFRALVVVGDGKHRVGVGTAKGADVTAAVAKAVEVAKKQMITFPMYKGTIPHEATAKVGGSNILIKPASEGTGLIAGGTVRTVLEVGGVKNIVSKSIGGGNRNNTAQATIEALRSLVPAKDWTTRTGSNAPKAPAKKATAKKVEA